MYKPQRSSEGGGNRTAIAVVIIAVSIILIAVATIFLLYKKPAGTPENTKLPGENKTAPPVSKTTAPPDYTAMRLELLTEADKLARGYFYDEAIDLIKNSDTNIQNDETASKVEEITALKGSLVKYEETQLYHIFFHSLIIDNSLAFDKKGHPAEGYNMWMTTQKEFKDMLPLLLDKGFVLYDITKLVNFDEAGHASRADIYLPEGKKPLVISIDDVNYYDYMKPDGFADRLDVDSEGNVVTVVKNPDGSEKNTYDGDVMPILDAFVKEHPEFSYKGAKGVVALTGYQGAFGYRITDLEKYSKEEGDKMLAKVKEVATALRATGWQIANHSYTHNRYWIDTITMDQLKYDIGRWKRDIMAYVGDTNILITPFGATFKDNDPRFQYILDQGFTIFCPVGSGMATVFTDRAMRQDRLNVDGFNMIKFPERIKKYLFDPSLILDPDRPPLS